MDQPLPDDFPEVLRNCFTNLSKVFKVQNSLKRIPDYDGESDQGFNRWLQALELVFQTASAETDVEKKELALQTLSGRAAEFLSRKFRLNNDITWVETRAALKTQFGDQADSSLTMKKLRSITQRPGESIQNFAERIRQQAHLAYPDVLIGDNHVLTQTVMETLMEGVRDSAVARRIIKENPQTFEAAIEIATDEQRTTRVFDARRGEEEAMEINVLGKQAVSEVSKLTGQIEKLSDQVNAISRAPPLTIPQAIPRRNVSGSRPHFPQPPPLMGVESQAGSSQQLLDL